MAGLENINRAFEASYESDENKYACINAEIADDNVYDNVKVDRISGLKTKNEERRANTNRKFQKRCFIVLVLVLVFLAAVSVCIILLTKILGK